MALKWPHWQGAWVFTCICCSRHHHTSSPQTRDCQTYSNFKFVSIKSKYFSIASVWLSLSETVTLTSSIPMTWYVLRWGVANLHQLAMSNVIHLVTQTHADTTLNVPSQALTTVACRKYYCLSSHNLKLLLFANANAKKDINSKYNCACDGSAWVTKGDSCVATMPNWLLIFIPCAFITLIFASCLVYCRLRRTMKPDELA